MVREAENISVRLHGGFLDGMEEILKREIYTSRADVIRDALREKMEKEIPEFFSKMGKEEQL